MPLVISAGFAELTWAWLLAGDPEPMSVSFGVTGVVTLANLQDACDAWDTIYTDNLLPTLSSEYTYQGTFGRTDPAGSNLVAETINVEAGAGGPGVLPQNCALIVKKLTGLGGRQKRGRSFYPGMLAEGDVDSKGAIDPAIVTTIQGLYTQVLIDGIATPFDMQLLHSDEVRNPAFPPPATTMMPNPDPNPDPVTTLTVEPVIATQRRRLR